MKEHSHCKTLIELLKNNPQVYIKDIRGWCNYRSRMSDIRPAVALEGMAIVSCIVEGQHAYKLEPIVRQPEPVVIKDKQMEFQMSGAQ